MCHKYVIVAVTQTQKLNNSKCAHCTEDVNLLV